jgi:hypothetical protein
VDQRGISAGYKGVFTLIGSAIGVGVITALFAVKLANVAYMLIAGIFAYNVHQCLCHAALR